MEWTALRFVGAHNINSQSGGCLLKVLVRESYLDSNATASTIRLQLSSLDTYIPGNSMDIIGFNAHVRSLMNGLTARGEGTEDLLVNLFKEYRACTDADFLQHLSTIENAHKDGSAPILPNGQQMGGREESNGRAPHNGGSPE